MPFYAKIDIDFDVYKALTALRESPEDSENAVLRRTLSLPPDKSLSAETTAVPYWVSDGAKFPVGTQLRHQFRDGRAVGAVIVPNGVSFNDIIYPGLSPAAAAAAGHPANGWTFWELRTPSGMWVKADILRQHFSPDGRPLL